MAAGSGKSVGNAAVERQNVPLGQPAGPFRVTRTALAGLGVIVLLVIMLAGFSVYESRMRAEERVTTITQNLALLLERTLQGIIDKTDLTLHAVQLVTESRLVADSMDGQALNAYLLHQQSLMPELETLRITRADGAIAYGSGAAERAGMSVADRDYFIRARDDKNAGLIIDGPIVSRFTQKPVVVFSRRLTRADGSFAGVAYAVISVQHFGGLFSNMDLGTHGAVSLRSANLALIARFPETNRGAAIGSTVVSAQLSALVRATPRGGAYTATTALDNIERMNVVRRVGDYPLYVIVGIGTEDVLSAWRIEAMRTIILSLLLIAVILSASRLMYSSWREQVSAREAFARVSSRYQQFLRNASDGVHILDKEGNLLEMSDSFGAMLGYSRDELFGRNVREWDATAATANPPAAHALFETRHRRRDGSEIDVEINSHPLELDGRTVIFNSSRDVTERKRANAEREHFAAIVANSNDAIVGRSLDGTVISWNPAAERLFGYAAGEVIGRNVREVLVPGPLTDVTADRHAMRPGNVVSNYEAVGVARDGRPLNLSLSMFPLKDSAGRMVGTSSIARDNSERVRAEEARARLAAIVEHSSDAIIGRDLDGKIVSWNAGAERLFGYPAEEAIGQDGFLLTPPALREEVQERREAASAGKTVTSYESVGVARDGHHIDVSLSVSQIVGADGTVVGTATIARDISERKRAEESRALLATIVEGASDAIISRTLDNKVTSWNKAAERLFGYSAAEALGSDIGVTPEDRMEESQRNRTLLAAGVPVFTYETVRLAKGGRRIDVSLSGSPIKDADGNVIGTATIMRDIAERKQAAAAIAESDSRFSAAFDQAAVGMGLRAIDPANPRWLRVNQKFCDMLGYTSEELTDMTSFDISLPEDREQSRLYNDRLMSGDSVRISREKRYVRKDGKIIWVNIFATAVRSPAGEPIYVMSVIDDITLQKLAEEARARLAAIVESSQDAIISRTLDGVILSWNAGAERLFGWTADEAIGCGMGLIVPPERRDYFERNHQRIRQGDVPLAYDGVNLAKDGRRIPVSISLSPVRGPDGVISHVATVIRDITEAKRAEAQLRLAAGVFDTAAEGIIITGRDNKVVAVNPAFTEITGYKSQDLVGKYPRLHYAGRRSCGVYKEISRAVEATGRWQGEVWDRRKNGERYCEWLSVSAIRDESGAVVQHCVILMDITPRKVAEDALRHLNDGLELRVAERTRELEYANRELDAFSYSVSHDLRAPLRAISGFGALALRATGDRREADMLEFVGKMRAGAERMGRLIDDLLRLSRISRQQIRRQEFDLSRIAHQVADALAAAAPARTVAVSIVDGMHANGDRSLMRIVLDNLIGNAWKFTANAQDAALEVGTDTRGGETVYYVRDNGAGFDMQYADKLFSAFQRLHSTEFEGTGIGLSIVNRIITRHGGRIWAARA